MTKWKQLEQQLQGVFGSARVRADGHDVSFYKQPQGERLVIVAYVDSCVRGPWMSVDDQGKPKHSEGRFFRPRKHRVYQLKQYNKLKRVFGKKRADEMTALRTYMLDPTWNSPKTLVSHLKKHFPDLELVQEHTAEDEDVDPEALASPSLKREVRP